MNFYTTPKGGKAVTNMNDPAHRGVPWFWEAGSEKCPHGPEPDMESEERDEWDERHPDSPEGIVVCLDAPVGIGCEECSLEVGEYTPLEDCRIRAHAYLVPGAGVPERRDHCPVEAWVGTADCLERMCEEYVDDSGKDMSEVERCSHITTEMICGTCSTLVYEEYYDPSVPWPCTIRAGRTRR